MQKAVSSSSLAAVLLVSLVLASPASAGKKVIVNGGDTTSDVGGCGTRSNPCDTIQSGIDNAAPGDTVEVRAGTYAGATIDKAVALMTAGKVVIDTGPATIAGGLLRVGFMFPGGGVGSGASIRGFEFAGTRQVSVAPDDGKLDFGVFSRGAANVAVEHNSLNNLLQAVTNWNGTGWSIQHNAITDLWTVCGGGIGILAGGFDGSAIMGHTIAHNTVQGIVRVSPTDCGGYDATGLVLYADFRFGRAGASSISNNRLGFNHVELTSDAPAVVNANGIEVTVASDPPVPTTITDNLIDRNIIEGMSGNGIAVSEGSSDNLFEKNHATGSGETDVTDDSTGAGTAGTANTWTGNACGSSSPAGLCK